MKHVAAVPAFGRLYGAPSLSRANDRDTSMESDLSREPSTCAENTAQTFRGVYECLVGKPAFPSHVMRRLQPRRRYVHPMDIIRLYAMRCRRKVDYEFWGQVSMHRLWQPCDRLHHVLSRKPRARVAARIVSQKFGWARAANLAPVAPASVGTRDHPRACIEGDLTS